MVEYKPKTVVILGAGASKEAGVPLMGEFLDSSYRLWRIGKINDTDGDFELVFRALSGLQSVHSKCILDITNVEAIFSTFEIGFIR